MGHNKEIDIVPGVSRYNAYLIIPIKWKNLLLVSWWSLLRFAILAEANFTFEIPPSYHMQHTHIHKYARPLMQVKNISVRAIFLRESVKEVETTSSNISFAVCRLTTETDEIRIFFPLKFSFALLFL